MHVEEVKECNPSFTITRYKMSETCYGDIIKDKMGRMGVRYYLNDDKRDYVVPEEVFKLWIRAYDCGYDQGVGESASKVDSLREELQYRANTEADK